MKGKLSTDAAVNIGNVSVIIAKGTELDIVEAVTYDQAAELSYIAKLPIDWTHNETNDNETDEVTVASDELIPPGTQGSDG